MYKLEYLPVARKDMIEIVRYISRELQNPDAADRLAVELVNAAESVLTFPYAAPAYFEMSAKLFLKSETGRIIFILSSSFALSYHNYAKLSTLFPCHK